MNDQPSNLRVAEVAFEDVDYGVSQGLKWADTLFRAILRADADDRLELADIGSTLMDRTRSTAREDMKALRLALSKLNEVAR